MSNKFFINYNLILLSLIPFSFLLGPSVSLLNIILVSLSFIVILFQKKFFYIMKENVIISLLIIYIYLFFNSLISIDYKEGILRNVGFIRFILLFCVVNYFFFLDNLKKNYFFKPWLVIILIVLLDVFIEIIFGRNILGYSAEGDNRIVSFFKDEPNIVGYLNGFIFLIFGYLTLNFKEKSKINKLLIFLFFIISLLIISLSFERSNTIKFFIGVLIFFGMNQNIKLKFKILGLFLLAILVTTLFLNFSYFKTRYYNDFVSQIIDKDKREWMFENNRYIQIYKSGIEVFKNYPFFGVGNKNYRIEACGDIPASHLHSIEKKKYNTFACLTHPHQIYLEFLSEHGIVGTMLLLGIIFYLVFRNLKIIFLSKNFLQIGSFSYLLINFVPLIPSGSFFNDFNSTLFWLNFSVLYAANSRTNIFHKLKN